MLEESEGKEGEGVQGEELSRWGSSAAPCGQNILQNILLQVAKKQKGIHLCCPRSRQCMHSSIMSRVNLNHMLHAFIHMWTFCDPLQVCNKVGGEGPGHGNSAKVDTRQSTIHLEWNTVATARCVSSR